MCQIKKKKKNGTKPPSPPHYQKIIFFLRFMYMDLKKKQNSMYLYLYMNLREKKVFSDNEGEVVVWCQFFFLFDTFF